MLEANPYTPTVDGLMRRNQKGTEKKYKTIDGRPAASISN